MQTYGQSKNKITRARNNAPEEDHELDEVASETSAADDAKAPEDAEVPAETEKAKEVTRDYGLWKFTPWKGIDHWVHPSGRSTFKESEARRLKNLK